jgi:BirA family biotin operon repressor/biotin-[acetyl-CoA-carboxylase] ligase
VASPYRDLDRPPLSAVRLQRALVRPGSLWTSIEVRSTTASTNADVIEAAKAGAAEGLVIVAEQQTAGRGRLDRHWLSPARAGIAMSMLLRPGDRGRGYAAASAAQLGWLPLLVAVATVEAIGRLARLDAGLKWPNDVLLGDDERKAGGILSEAVPRNGHPPAIVIGLGLNVTLRPDELPVPGATSLAIEHAAATDRDPLVREILRRTEHWYDRWLAAKGNADECGLGLTYRDHCRTLGRAVLIDLPGGRQRSGTAIDVDATGRLVVATESGIEAVSAGDVVHVQPGPRAGHPASDG